MNDKEFQGFYCVAIIEIGNSFLLFMDEKGKKGLLNISAIVSISEAETHKYTRLPNIPNIQSTSLEFLVGKLCDVKMRQENQLFTKPGTICAVKINTITDHQIMMNGQKGELYTLSASNVLFIKER